MKKCFIVLAVSGLFLVAEPLCAQQNQGEKMQGSEAPRISKILNESQLAEVKKFTQKNSDQRHSVMVKMRRDRQALKAIIFAKTIDQSRLNKALAAYAADQSSMIEMRVKKLNFIYNIATPEQQKEIALKINEMSNYANHYFGSSQGRKA